MGTIRITVVVENSTRDRGLRGEHGLAFLIETGSWRVLFDTGPGTVWTHNAAALGIADAPVDAIVLSHGHDDHTGGLEEALTRYPGVPTFCHPAALEPKFAVRPEAGARAAGIPPACRRMLADTGFAALVNAPVEVCPGFLLTGPIPRLTDFEDSTDPFFLDPDGIEPDLLADDQAGILHTRNGMIVVTGCAHAGLVNTLLYVNALTGNRPIHAVIGGLHLEKANGKRLDRTVAELHRFRIRRLMPCHCTGMSATVRLWQEFPAACESCRTGTVLTL